MRWLSDIHWLSDGWAGETPVYKHVEYQQNQAKIHPRSVKNSKSFHSAWIWEWEIRSEMVSDAYV